MNFEDTIQSMFKKIFMFEGPISDDIGRSDIPKWDSLKHVVLVTDMEEKFKLRFSLEEIIEMRTIGDIRRVLIRHGALDN